MTEFRREITLGGEPIEYDGDPQWDMDDGTVYRLHYYPPQDELWYLEIDEATDAPKMGGQAMLSSREEHADIAHMLDRLPIYVRPTIRLVQGC